jgi:hypothetical protein
MVLKDARSEEMCQRALAGYEKALGSDYISTLDTFNSFGCLYSEQGKVREQLAKIFILSISSHLIYWE